MLSFLDWKLLQNYSTMQRNDDFTQAITKEEKQNYFARWEFDTIILIIYAFSQLYIIVDSWLYVFSFQKMVSQTSSSLDLIRTLRMSGYGLLILGPSQHLWFNFVAKVLPQRDVISTFKKIIMGQATFGPCINSVFFSFNAALQGTQIFIWLLISPFLLNVLVVVVVILCFSI